MTPQSFELPVLVIGAGPAGLMTASTLAHHGVSTLLVERRTELSALPKATVVSTRSMELFRSWGLRDQMLAGSVDVEWQLLLCQTLAKASEGWVSPVGLPSREQAAVVSPSAPACVPQDYLEPVLLDHLRSLGPCEVALGTEVTSLRNAPDGVTAVLRDVATGRSRTVRARYAVAADGAHSAVRAAIGISMHGPEQLLGAVTAVFHAPLWDVLGERRYGIYGVTEPGATGTFLPAGPPDRWIYAAREMALDSARAPDVAEVLTGLIRCGAGVAGLPVEIERIGSFSSAAQLADRFRQGSVFLVGDAAHRVTPRGGTGMNTAIHDGYDLGWKLGWVLRGWAAPELLDCYESERRPVAAHNTARSADPDGTTRDAVEELPLDLGGRIPHVWLPAGTGRESTLDLLGPGLTLFTGPEPGSPDGRWAHAAASLSGPLPIAVRSLDAIPARALGIHRGGALLARPDGVPAASWSAGVDAPVALRAAVRSLVAADRRHDGGRLSPPGTRQVA